MNSCTLFSKVIFMKNNTSVISQTFSDPTVQNLCQFNHHRISGLISLRYLFYSSLLLGENSFYTSLGLKKIKFTSLLTYSPLLTFRAPTQQAATCASHCEMTHWPPLYPLCGEPEMIYEPNRLVPSDSDALQS